MADPSLPPVRRPDPESAHPPIDLVQGQSELTRGHLCGGGLPEDAFHEPPCRVTLLLRHRFRLSCTSGQGCAQFSLEVMDTDRAFSSGECGAFQNPEELTDVPRPVMGLKEAEGCSTQRLPPQAAQGVSSQKRDVLGP